MAKTYYTITTSSEYNLTSKDIEDLKKLDASHWDANHSYFMEQIQILNPFVISLIYSHTPTGRFIPEKAGTLEAIDPNTLRAYKQINKSTLIGYCISYPYDKRSGNKNFYDTGWISALLVSKRHRGKQFGWSLLTASIKELQTKHKIVGVSLKVDADVEEALEFYNKFSFGDRKFQFVATLPNDYGQGQHSILYTMHI